MTIQQHMRKYTNDLMVGDFYIIFVNGKPCIYGIDCGGKY